MVGAESCVDDCGVKHMPLIRSLPVFSHYCQASREGEFERMLKILKTKPFCDWMDDSTINNFYKKLTCNGKQQIG